MNNTQEGARVRVLIAGGGVIGLCTAQALAQAGCAVTLCERNNGAEEASWASGGILAPLIPWQVPACLQGLVADGQRQYPELARTLLHHTGIDPEYRASGALVLDVRQPAAALAWATANGADAVRWGRGKLETAEPRLRAGSALYFPRLAQIRSPRLMRALYARLEQIGVRVLRQSEVRGWELSGGRVTAAVAGSQRLHADVFIAAAGAWSGALLESTGLCLPVVPVRGQMLGFAAEPDVLRHILLAPEVYAVPRAGGVLVVGSTLEQAGFDKRTTLEAAATLHAAVARYLPFLKDLKPSWHWAGLRPAPADDRPYMGRHPGLENLFISTGHHRLGLTLAPASAELLKDLVLERTPCFDPAPFSLQARAGLAL